jgi:hypothetical protein
MWCGWRDVRLPTDSLYRYVRNNGSEVTATFVFKETNVHFAHARTVISGDTMYLDVLATSRPHNGYGSLLMVNVIWSALWSRKPLEWNSLPGAVGFYKYITCDNSKQNVEYFTMSRREIYRFCWYGIICNPRFRLTLIPSQLPDECVENEIEKLNDRFF